MVRSFSLRTAAFLILLAAAATIGGALYFEHVLGLLPCKLCLLQRNPYYIAIPLALVAALAPPFWTRIGLFCLGMIFCVSVAFGLYHAGVEWSWWVGPNDCGGTAAPVAESVEGFLKQLGTARVVSCTEAAWRFLGLSLAGWNSLISAFLAFLAFTFAFRRPA